MPQIKLVGREMAVVRAIEHAGSTGAYLQERTNIQVEDLLDTLNGLAETGYVEAYLGESATPVMGSVQSADFEEARFEINPAYYLELKKVMQRR